MVPELETELIQISGFLPESPPKETLCNDINLYGPRMRSN